MDKEIICVLCKNCKYWGNKRYEWDGHCPCDNNNGRFFIGGGDNNDSLYTKPNFGCIDGLTINEDNN